MESGIQSSFIPKDASAQTPIPRRAEGGGLADLFFLLSIVLFVASLALAGAVFLYEQYAQSSSASKLDQLQRAKAAFEPSLIQELTRLDDRMRVAETLLNAHLAPTALFNALSQSTLATVSFQSLDFQAVDAQHLKIKMQGIARGVNSIALEGDIFSKNGIIANPIFSNISRQLDGVHFTLNAVVNPMTISYLAQQQAAPASVSPTTQIQQTQQIQQNQAQQPQQTSPFTGQPDTSSVQQSQSNSLLVPPQQ